MVSINYSAREVCCKIVYYGPGLSGKTTNLQYIHAKVPTTTRGKLISLATEADRTLYFDFLPINIGAINGFTAKFQLYTVPGQVYYNATRKLVLRGVDGVVFVADSQPDKMDENVESLLNLEENLREYGYDMDTLPVVIQFNKRDLPGVLQEDVLNQALNKRGWPSFGASATVGNGVFDTLKMIIKLVLDKAKQSSAPKMKTAAAQPQPQPQAEPVQAAAPAESPAPDESYQRVPAEPAAQAPEPAPEPKPAPAVVGAAAAPSYRPYPGSEAPAAAAPQKKMSPASFAPSQSDELPASSLEKTVVSAEDGATDREPSDSASAPQMAPSLRRRGDAKKRGFFKRLFGIR